MPGLRAKSEKVVRKSFLSRVDGGHAIHVTRKSKDADHFIKSLNNACRVVLEHIIRFAPGMHQVKLGKSGKSGKKRKHKGIVGKFV